MNPQEMFDYHFPRLRELLGLPPYKEGDNMSADNYALVGMHPLAGTGLFSTTLHGVYVGFMSSDKHPTEIPESSRHFATHEKAAAYANELETEYGESFLCDCHRETDDENEKPQLSEWEKELLYPTPKKTVRQVIQEYSDILNVIYEARTAGDFTWKGLLHEFMDEIASTEDE